MTDQRAAVLPVRPRRGRGGPVRPTAGASLWIGPNGGQAVRATDGRTLSRPSWALDDAVWVVVDGNSVVRVIREEASGQPARIPVDSAAVTSRFPGSITELQVSRDGTRVAMVIDGQVVLAGVEQTPGGEFALTYPRRIGFGLGNSVVSLSWRTGDDMVVTRSDPAHPVSYVNLDGVNSDGPSNNLVMPVSAVAANPSAVYVADARGVLQLLATSAANGQAWSELRPFMVPGAVPVMPGLSLALGCPRGVRAPDHTDRRARPRPASWNAVAAAAQPPAGARTARLHCRSTPTNRMWSARASTRGRGVRVGSLRRSAPAGHRRTQGARPR